MRLEKNWGVWTLDFRPDFTAAEAGLDSFIRFEQAGRISSARPPRRRKRRQARRSGWSPWWSTPTASPTVNRDEPLFHGGECVGYVTSGGYAHFVGKSVALGYVPAMLARPEEKFEVEILGERRPARVQAEPLYDPSGSKMRS